MIVARHATGTRPRPPIGLISLIEPCDLPKHVRDASKRFPASPRSMGGNQLSIARNQHGLAGCGVVASWVREKRTSPCPREVAKSLEPASPLAHVSPVIRSPPPCRLSWRRGSCAPVIYHDGGLPSTGIAPADAALIASGARQSVGLPGAGGPEVPSSMEDTHLPLASVDAGTPRDPCESRPGRTT
jgi:hypothetical protein